MDIECQLDCGSYGVFLTTELALTQQIPIYQSIHTQTRAMCLMLAMAGPLHGPHPKSESNSSWQYLRKQTKTKANSKWKLFDAFAMYINI